MTNEISGRSNYMASMRMEEDCTPFNSEEFLRELEADLNEDDSQSDGSSRIPNVDRIPVEVRRIRFNQTEQCSNRPTLSNKFMLKGLIERTEHYNKTVDRRVMTDARIAFEEEQFRSGKGQNTTTDEVEVLALSSQNIPKRGRGDYFGKMRSAAAYGASSSISNNNNNNTTSNFNGFLKTTNRNFNIPFLSDKGKDDLELSERDSRILEFRPPRRFGSRLTEAEGEKPLARHHFNPETAYNGTITPDYRFNYTPQTAFSCPHVQPTKPVYPGMLQPTPPVFVPPLRSGQRYPKRPDNNPPIAPVPSVPKHLNHNYYTIELYGATQDERIAQRIEKTVRQTEAPPRRF
ncbi:unnamed protein product [Caenorhabditis brenneri]